MEIIQIILIFIIKFAVVTIGYLLFAIGICILYKSLENKICVKMDYKKRYAFYILSIFLLGMSFLEFFLGFKLFLPNNRFGIGIFFSTFTSHLLAIISLSLLTCNGEFGQNLVDLALLFILVLGYLEFGLTVL